MQVRRSPFFAVPLFLAAATFALLQTMCGTPAQSMEKHGLRIATYNIGWLSEGMTSERQAHLKSVLKNLDPDIIAMQEIQGRKALEKIFNQTIWQIGIMDTLSESQEPAIAVKKPWQLIGNVTTVFPDNAFDFAFPGERDVLRAVVKAPNGMHIALYVVHMKSRGGPGGRRATDLQRIMACSMLAAYIRGQKDDNVIVLGDFNDTPDDASMRILQTGNLLAKASLTDDTGPFLYDLMTPLNKQDEVTFGVDQIYRGVPLSPKVKGARTENDRWRGKEYRYPDDLAVTQALFDQILVSKSLYEVRQNDAVIYCGKDALEGIPGQASKAASGYVRYDRQGSLASDHLPVYADFRIAAK